MTDEDWTTRRAPHMEKYVEVSQYCEGEPWMVRLRVGVQTFNIGDGQDTKDEAEWIRDMLCIALDAMVKECSI